MWITSSCDALKLVIWKSEKFISNMVDDSCKVYSIFQVSKVIFYFMSVLFSILNV